MRAGQLIGYAGNTGFSNGPHLHFEVYRMKDEMPESIPVTFRTAHQPIATVAVGQYYAAAAFRE